MNKKRVIILIFVALFFALVGYGFGSLAKHHDTPAALEDTQAPSTEPETQPTEAKPVSVFENGQFSFTAGEFRDRFKDSLPAGYSFVETVEALPSRRSELQFTILNSAGESTGIAVLMNAKDPAERFRKIALTAGTDCSEEDFSILTDWFVSRFLPTLEVSKKDAWVEECLGIFQSKKDGFANITTREAVAILILEQEEIGQQYYVMVAVNEP